MIYATEQQVVVTSVAIVTVALVALFTGIIWGRRRGLEEAAEEARWAQENSKSQSGLALTGIPPEVAHEAWLAHEDQALTLANDKRLTEAEMFPWAGSANITTAVLEPTAVISPGEESVTAWTKRMAEDMDRFLRDLIGGTDQQLKEITR